MEKYFLCFLASFLPSLLEGSVAEPLFVRGDANMSGGTNPVDAADAIVVLRYLNMIPDHGVLHFDAADANDDGLVTFEDVLRIWRFLFVGDPPLPQPYPFPGSDPTEDRITSTTVLPPAEEPPLSPDYKVWLYWATSPHADGNVAVLRLRLSYHGITVRPASQLHAAIRYDPNSMKFLNATTLLPEPWQCLVADYTKAPTPAEIPGEVGITLLHEGSIHEPKIIPGGTDLVALSFALSASGVIPQKKIGLEFNVGEMNLYYYTGTGVFVPSLVSPVGPSLVPIVVISLRETASRFIRADANRDGEINLADVIYSLGSLFQGLGIPACLDAADSNDSGTFDISDPMYTLRWLFLGGEPPPPPFGPIPGACGLDPTDDPLRCEFYEPCYESIIGPILTD